MLQIVKPTVAEPQAEPVTPLLVELRTSMEASAVTWALVQADYALKRRPAPEKLSNLHHAERRKYEDVALVAVLSMNRDAELYAEESARVAVFELFEQFCKDHDLNWLTDHPINDGDGLEVLLGRLTTSAVKRFRQVMCGVYPGLTQHLAKLLEHGREGAVEMCWSCSQYPAPRPGTQCDQCWKENQ